MRFSYRKYVDWRKKHDKLSEEDIALLNTFDDYKAYDNETYENMWKMGKAIIKDWCEE